MKTAAVDPSGETPLVLPHRRPFFDFAELVKAPLTTLVLLTTAVGYYLGADPPVLLAGFFHVMFGTALTAAAAAALNQFWERRLDGLMHRTRARPLPGGRMQPRDALIIGSVLGVAGVVYLAVACNYLTAFLAALTVVIYLFAYTPLKRVSDTNTLVGAIPGALPPMIGWAAARGQIEAGAWSLFALMFFWQLPHFFAIAWMFREDYSRAGFRMISTDDPSGQKSASQSVFFCIMLLVFAGLPAFVGLTTLTYLIGELILGGLFIFVAMRFLQAPDRTRARQLFFASIIYLPLLLIDLVVTKA